MSTTVTYKDNTLITVNNTTKTLKTAGKYMEDDVILTDTNSGGGGDTYTLTTVVPQQTFTPQVLDNSYQNTVTYTAGLEDGESYLVTFDGEQYICDCGVMWGTDYMAGDIVLLWDKSGMLNEIYPFGLDYVPSTSEFGVGTHDLNSHTIKVEHLEFVDGPLNLIAKSVTANGTYNASSDNADGYSSVTVNVSGGGSATYRLDNIISEQTVACTTFNQNNSYYGLLTFSSVIEDSEQYLVTFDGTEYVCEGYIPSANVTGVGDVRVVNTNSASYLITPFYIGYQTSNMGLFVRGSGTHTVKVDKLTFIDDGETFTTKTITQNGTYSASSDNADGYSSVTVNVSGGMDMPVFTVVMTPDYSAAQSVTCSMTFAECTNYVNDNDMALVEMSAQGDNDTFLFSASLYQGSPTEITFVMFLGGIPQADVSIMSNGTCSFTNQPSTVTTLTATANGTYTDSLNRLYSEVTVNVPSGSSMNVQTAQSTTRVASTTYIKTASLTCSVSGTYDVYWDCFRSSTSGTNGSQLYIGGNEYGNPNTTFASNVHAQTNHLTGVQINANQEVAVYVRSRATNYYAYCGQLTIVQTA